LLYFVVLVDVKTTRLSRKSIICVYKKPSVIYIDEYYMNMNLGSI